MSDSVHQIKSYWRYYWRAKTIYQIHSPFLFQYLTTTRDASKLYYDFQEFDDRRRLLELDQRSVRDEDPGAGSHKSPKELTVGHIAKTALSSRKKCEWLYRTVLFLEPESTIELGASLGLSTLYLAGACPNGHVYSLEGRPTIARVARHTADVSSCNNITIVPGLFEDTLVPLLGELKQLDFLILDGNHRYDPTMKYAQQILKDHKPTVMLVDDIYWSKEMTKAWEELKNRPEFNVAIDFYDYGILFYRPEIEKRIDIAYIDYYKKFWKFGLWN